MSIDNADDFAFLPDEDFSKEIDAVFGEDSSNNEDGLDRLLWREENEEMLTETCRPSSKDSETAPSSDIFGYIKVLRVEKLAKKFLEATRRQQDIVIRTDWPKDKPPGGFFYGQFRMKTVDFGGIDAGTVCLTSDGSLGLLVNYSGSNKDKLSKIYPDLPNLKIWKIRLFKLESPSPGEESWMEHQTKSGLVYLFSSFAMYFYGGETYILDSFGRLVLDPIEDIPLSKPIINLGPSNKRPAAKSESKVSFKKAKKN